MSLATYLLYLGAVAVLVATPGPTMLMCVSNAINHGPRRALASGAGAIAASFVIMAASALGLGALLAASEAAFTGLKVFGAIYLIWLGIMTFHSQAAPVSSMAPRQSRSFFVQGLLVGASNPKALIFFAAFFPQFIDASQPAAWQFAVLAFTFMAGDGLMMLLCTLGVGRIAPLLRQHSAIRWINRTCGTFFALLGGMLLFVRRNA
ncbi:LysE family translocator [Caenimonas koreensis DSM 17982]|uniref:LysE family translocator n=1 Tax=Caenimonas koreensis DSM 17982 TaxID=1121255 RepID=A0A844ATN9_9BURK|nr:LysE family translocator [Caenimonas koreensis]MRD45708.1 LysE family translocator [Caenimonas koreensis DSM 17982]